MSGAGHVLLDVPNRGRVVLDPIYGYVPLPNQLQALIDDPLVQRLRGISQTSRASLVYPSMTGTRFEHGVGAMYLAMRGWLAAWANSPAQHQRFEAAIEASQIRVQKKDDFPGLIRLAIGASALLHDVGHPPFSHALEHLYDEFADSLLSGDPTMARDYRNSGLPFHEFASVRLGNQLRHCFDPPQLGDLVDHIHAASGDDQTWASALKGVIAGEVDVDRLDYLLRDADRAGTEYGAIDYERIVDSLEIHESPDGGFQIAPGYRARSAAENLLVQRSNAFRWVYFHPRVVAYDLWILRSLQIIKRLETEAEIVPGPLGTAASAARVIGELFQRIAPNLDYLSPSIDAGGDEFGLPTPPAEAADLFQLASFDRDQIRISLQASLDDSTIVEWVRRAARLSQMLLLQPISPALKSRLLTFQAYFEAWALRRKNFFPAWKSYEEYADVAKEVTSEGRLLHAVEAAWGILIDEVKDRGSNAVDIASALRDVSISHVVRGGVPALNYVASSILRGDSRPLAGYLNQNARRIDSDRAGFWDAAYRHFEPLKRGRQMAVVYKGQDPAALSETSPLVRSLAENEDYRVRLFTYYFVVPYSSAKDLDSREFRRKLAYQFAHNFPGFVSRSYPATQRKVLAGEIDRRLE